MAQDFDPRELNIDTFKERFQTGARPYMFYFEPQWPQVYKPQSRDIRFLVRSTSLPRSGFDEIKVAWQGFDYKAAGKRSYDDWSVTFTVDVEAKIRFDFLNWQKAILDPATNFHALPNSYFSDQVVTLLNVTTMRPAIQYTLKHVWPKQVGEIRLAYDDTNSYAQFDVTFTYVYFTYGNV